MSTPNLTDIEIMVLGAKVDAELADASFSTRTHGTRSCYNQAGCRGPLCTYIMRRMRRTEDTVTVSQKELDDYLEGRLTQHHADHQTRLANRRRA